MVETLRRFDPATQRSTGPTDQVLIVPVRERFDDDDAGDLAERHAGSDAIHVGPSAALTPAGQLSVLEFLRATQSVRLIVSEYEQVEQQATRVREQLEASFAEAAGRGHAGGRPPDDAFVAGRISRRGCRPRHDSKS